MLIDFVHDIIIVKKHLFSRQNKHNHVNFTQKASQLLFTSTFDCMPAVLKSYQLYANTSSQFFFEQSLNYFLDGGRRTRWVAV